MKREEIIAIIKQEKVVAILRAKNQSDVKEVIKVVFSAGMNVLEITSNTPEYLEEIEKARKQYPNKLIGAGTVINPKIAKLAIDAGAQFLVTPNTNVEVIQLAHKFDVPVMVGALTPTEIYIAHENGADVIKLFPAAAGNNFGVDYLKAVKGPLDTIEYFAVGGISIKNVEEWFNSGVSGVGYGCLIKNAAGNVDLKATKETAEIFLKAAKI